MGNFWGDFAGAFQKSYDSAQRNSRENAAAKRDQERFDREKQGWAEEDQLKTRVSAAGYTLDDPTKPDGLMTADDYNRQFAAPTPKKGKQQRTALPTPVEQGNINTSQLPATNNPDGSHSTVRTIGVEQNGREYNIPTVIDGKVVSNEEAIAAFQKTGRHLGAFRNAQDAERAAVGLHDAEADRIAPKKDDFVPIEVNGQIMYAPRSRVKMKDNATYVADVGRAVMSVDKVVGTNMLQAAQVMEGRNLELSAKKWGAAVMEAERIGGEGGIQHLAKMFDDLPDGQSVQWSRDKDGNVHLKFYADTQGGPVATQDRVFKPRQGVTAEQAVFEYARSLASPESMGQYLTTMAQAAQTEFTNVLAIKQDKRADRRQELDEFQAKDASARGWASVNIARQELNERRAERLGTGPTSKIRAAATARLDKLLSNAQLDPTAPDYEQQYNAAVENILRVHPEIGAALQQADFTEQDQAPAKPKAAIPGFVAPMNGSPRAGGTPDPRKDPDVWTSPVTGRLSRYSNPKFVSPRDQAAAERQQQMMGEARGILRMGGAIRQSYEQQFQQKYGATVEQVLQQKR